MLKYRHTKDKYRPDLMTELVGERAQSMCGGDLVVINLGSSFQSCHVPLRVEFVVDFCVTVTYFRIMCICV